jgi:8-oxo-dGTP pyrophosphatase MutT (NUDIX family)
MTAAARRLVTHKGRQVAALCWRRAPRLEVLLVTSLRTHRWILPKGWTEDGVKPAVSAAREALEEAGVVGDIAPEPIGCYHYVKEKKDGVSLPCDVDIFPLEVIRQHRNWPEKGERDVVWLTPEQAAARVKEPELRHILADFAKAHPA